MRSPLAMKCRALLEAITRDDWPDVGIQQAAAHYGSMEQLEAVLEELLELRDISE